jgi:hypothetical protein
LARHEQSQTGAGGVKHQHYEWRVEALAWPKLQDWLNHMDDEGYELYQVEKRKDSVYVVIWRLPLDGEDLDGL